MDPAATFARYNLNGDGILDLSELQQLLEDAAFDVDSQYVDGLGSMFGTWDEDNSGGIELHEFQKMWDAIGLGDALWDAQSSSDSLRAGLEPSYVFVGRDPRAGYGLELGTDGRVLDVADPSKAAGVKVGWTIVAVDGQPVSGQGDILDLLSQVDGAELTLNPPAQQLGGSSPPPPPPPTAPRGIGVPDDDDGDLPPPAPRGIIVPDDDDDDLPPPPPLPGIGGSANDDDEVAAAFKRYNKNGDGLLDLPEIKLLLSDAQFEVDDQYINGIADIFGEWDTDGSGGIELEEFRQLWAQLDLGRMMREAKAAAAADEPSVSPLQSVKATCFGTITAKGSIGLELAETVDQISKTPTVHVQHIMPGSLAANHIPGLMVGMILVTVDCNPPSSEEFVIGMPYKEVLRKLTTRPVALGFGLSPFKLPAALTSALGTANMAARWRSHPRTREHTSTLEQTPQAGRTLSQVAETTSTKTEQGYRTTSTNESWAPVPEPEPEPEAKLPVERAPTMPSMPSKPELRDPQRVKQAAFNFFKGDDEILSEVELARLLDAADYEVDGGYIQQVLEIFGKFDGDGSSGIDFAEFGQLWDYLQLDEKMKLSGMEDMILGSSFAPQTAATLFNKYDTNQDGLLDADEVRVLMEDVGYEVDEADENYFSSIQEVFGKFDTDQGGTIGMSEFPALWKYLAPDRPLRDDTMDTAGMDIDQMFLCLQKFYRKFDPLRSKDRLWESVNLYNTPPKFQHLCNQLYAKYGEHPVAIWKGPEQMRPRDQICVKHLRAFESHVKHGQSALRAAESFLRTVTLNEQSFHIKSQNGTQYTGAGLNSVHRSQHRVTVKFEDKNQQVGLKLAPQWIDGVRVVRVQSILPRSMAARVRELSEGLTVELIDGTKVDDIKLFVIEKMLMRRPVTVVFGAGGSGEESAVRAHATTAKARSSQPTFYESDDETPVAREERLVRTRNQLRRARELGAVSLQQYDLVRADEHFLSEMDQALRQPNVKATFDKEGNLGIIFTAKDANSAPTIASIERNSLAAGKPQLEVGMELTAMQAQPIAGKTFRQVIADLHSAECPLTLEFKHPVSIRHRQERRVLSQRPYREAEAWQVKPSLGAAGLVVRALPSQLASSLGRVEASSIVRVVGKEGDWVQIEWSGARTGRQKWENRASAEGDEAVGWLPIEDRRTGKIFLEKSTGASYFNLGQSRAGVNTQRMLSPSDLEALLVEMREAVEQDDDAAMTRVLQTYAEAAKMDARVDVAWQELRAVRSAKRAEVAQQQQVEALRQHQMQLRRSGSRAQQTWLEQSWAERERAVASRLLN